MPRTQKTQLERFVKRLKHELNCELQEIERKFKSNVNSKHYQRLPELDCRRVTIQYIRDELIDECVKEVGP